MPILCDNFKDDELLVERLANSVCRFWNDNGGSDHGIKLLVGKDKVKEISHYGDKVLAAFFSNPPGPFKRLAALIILARLDGLFTLVTPDSATDNLKLVSPCANRDWISRICYLLISPTAKRLTATGSNGGRHHLNAWKGFPSLHSKIEFIFWLEWLCDYSQDYFAGSQYEDEKLIRRGRMILATSLILEAVYYQNCSHADVCGICDKTLLQGGNLQSLQFDTILLSKMKANQKTLSASK